MVDIVRMPVAELDGVSVHVLDCSTQSHAASQAIDNIPASKCYKNDTHRQKFLSGMMPIYSVSDNTRYFDINHKIAQLHGSCINDSNNEPVSPAAFRSTNPDLEFWLRMPQVTAVTKDLPVLGLHFELSQLPAAHAAAMEQFKSAVLAWSSNDQLFAMIREHFHVKCMLSGVHLKKGNHVILLEVLTDELLLRWPTLVEKIVSGLTVENTEHYGDRNAVLASEITQLVDTSSYKRVAKRRAPEQAELFCTTLKMKLFTELEQQLNSVILQVVKNAK